MITWFNNWAQGIILAVVIVTILEMILPEGKNKKYIKIVMGIYITFTIISPIISKITGDNFSIDVSKYEELLQGNSMQTTNNIESINNKSIENVYLSSIKADIKDVLNKEGYDATNIDITANINVQNEKAEIYKIDIQVTKNDKKEIKKVNKIEIGNYEPKKVNTISNNEINDLKEILSKKYEIEENKIYINGK